MKIIACAIVTRVNPVQLMGVFAALMLFLTGVSPVLSNQSDTEQELQNLRQNIAKITRKLARDRNKENSLLTELENMERKRARMYEQQHQYARARETLQVEKMENGVAAYNLQQQLKQAKHELNDLIRNSYILSQKDGLALLLNQQHPSQIFKNLAIYQYIARDRRDKIRAVKQLQVRRDEKLRQIEQQQLSINQLLDDLQTLKKNLATAENLRNAQLEKVKQDQVAGQNRVALLTTRENELQLLLDELAKSSKQAQNQAAESPSDSENSAIMQDVIDNGTGGIVPGGFKSALGRLDLPARGRIFNHYGEVRPESGLVWDGLMLEADQGQEVSVIFPGQVVFSDWFGSFGQLLVVDHGDGFMSLYGHNQTLNVGVGENVALRQQIATVGTTGGLESPALYFEIRQHGKPTDPLKWCRL